MACVVGFTFISTAVLTNIYKITPSDSTTAIASLAAAIFGGDSIWFYIFQIATVVILSLAANTAYAGMPLLLAMVARDGYLPRQFTQRGARLNFSNGVILIFVLASFLIFAFGADTHALLPLYATGVFVSFTISQAGMFMHWYKKKSQGWRKKAAVNAVGTIICAVVCIVIAVTRFTEGAWVVVILIPLLVAMKLVIRKHYDNVYDQIKLGEDINEKIHKHEFSCDGVAKVILPVQTINKSFVKALNYALSLNPKEIEFYNVCEEDGRDKALQEELEKLHIPNSHFMSETTYLRNVNEILLKHIDVELDKLEKGEMLTVIIPQLVCKRKIYSVLHNQTSVQLKIALADKRNVTVASIPYIIS